MKAGRQAFNSDFRSLIFQDTNQGVRFFGTANGARYQYNATTRINAGIEGYEAALKAAGVAYTAHVYEGTEHAFHSDTAGARYNEAAAKLAWTRTIAFLRSVLG